MVSDSLAHLDSSAVRRLVKVLQQFDRIADVDRDVKIRALFEIIAAGSLRVKCLVDDLLSGLQLLAHDLEVEPLLLNPQYAGLFPQCAQILDKLAPHDITQDAYANIAIACQENVQKALADAQPSNDLPLWLIDFVIDLLPADTSVHFIFLSASAIVPRLIHRVYQQERTSLALSVYDDKQSSEYLGLALVPFVEDLLAVRGIVHSQLRIRGYDTIVIDVSGFDGFDVVAEVDEILQERIPSLIRQLLKPVGRVIVIVPPSFLSGRRWQASRMALQENLKLEVIVDGTACSQLLGHTEPTNTIPSLVLLRQRSLASSARVTLFFPDRSLLPSKKSQQPLTDFVQYLQYMNVAEALFFKSQSASQVNKGAVADTESEAGVVTHLQLPRGVFQRPTSEVNDRWDLQYYSPARQQLQDQLINSAFMTWMGSVATLIQGTYQNTPSIDVVRLFEPDDIQNQMLVGRDGAVTAVTNVDSVRFEVHDILLPLYGTGRACLVPQAAVGAVCSTHFAIIRPTKTHHPAYLFVFIVGSAFQQQLESILAYPNELSLADLSELIVLMPDRAQQQAIAEDVLQCWDTSQPVPNGPVSRWLLPDRPLPVDEQWVPSSMLSLLFCDHERLYTLHDWLRLKGEYLRQLANALLWRVGVPDSTEMNIASWLERPHAERELDNLLRQYAAPSTPGLRNPLIILCVVHIYIEAICAAHTATTSAMSTLRATLRTLKSRSRYMPDRWLGDQFIRLATTLERLAQTVSERQPLHVQFATKTIVTDTPTVLKLAVTNQSHHPLLNIELTPQFPPQSILEQPAWVLPRLAPSETLFVEVRVRLGVAGVLPVAIALNYLVEHGAPIQAVVPLQLEVVPLDQAPFAPITANPYVTGIAVDVPGMFFGREDILAFLRSNLIGMNHSNVIILQGNRRTGKSSILKQIVRQRIFDPHVPVYIDCQGLGRLTSQLFYYKVGNEIFQAINLLEEAPRSRLGRECISEADPFYDFRALLDDFTQRIPGRRIVLLIDEFEVIDDQIQRGHLDPSVLEQLRHLFQHHEDIAVVLTGSYRLRRLHQEYWSPLFGIGLQREVGFLDEAATRQLITRPLEGWATFAAEVVDRIVQLTACQPYFVQMLCHNVVQELNRRRMYRSVTLDVVEDAAQETLTSADGHLTYMYKSIESPVAQAILVGMASQLAQPGAMSRYELEQFVDRYGLPVSRAGLEEALREMADRDLLAIQEPMESHRYIFKIDLVRQWIRRNYDLQSAIALAQVRER